MSDGSAGSILAQVDALFNSGSLAGLSDAQLLERFARRRDETAFGAIVSRHGPMVMATCRAAARDGQQAEDAFQATFLVLARKAGDAWSGRNLAGWLHVVGRRIARDAGRREARRRARERDGVDLSKLPAPAESATQELMAALHEEIDRLPEKYRAPVVLCELESLTRDQAAARLGWPPGTVAGRLARARDLLRDRLTRRGHAPAGAMAVMAAVPLPDGLAARVAREASSFVTSGGGAVPTASVKLALGVISAMNRLLIARAAAMVVGLGLAGWGLYAVAGGGEAPSPGAPQAVAPPRPAATLSGTVLGVDGKPAEGIRLFISRHDNRLGWGKVIAEAVTDAEGRFRIDRELVEGRERAQSGDVLWAYRPGSMVDRIELLPGAEVNTLPRPLALGPACRTVFVVKGPDGRPIEGARIEPRGLQQGYNSVPDRLADLIRDTTVTDGQGRAALEEFLVEDVRTVVVEADGYGRQQFGVDDTGKDLGPRTLNLLPAGSLEGRLVGDPDVIAGRDLLVTVSNPRRPPAPAAVLYYIQTDDDGRFQLPEVAEGIVGVSDRPGLASPWTVAWRTDLKIEAGQRTVAELPMERKIPIGGTVLAKETGEPVAGVTISDYTGRGAVVSDAQGRFSGYASPGRLYLWLTRSPDGFTGLMYGLPEFTIPTGAKEFEVPTIEVPRAVEVAGEAIDAEGQPVSGAEVRASWKVDEGPGRIGDRESKVWSDAEGRFVISKVNDGATVKLWASRGAMRSEEVTVTTGGAEPVRLKLEPGRMASLEGRVVGEDGQAIAGAHVHVRSLVRYSDGAEREIRLVMFERGAILTTDGEGKFRTPSELDPKGEYAAFGSASGFLNGRTGWVTGGSATLGDLKLATEAPTVRAAGRLVDREGRPIAGARVWTSGDEPTAATTDENGRFQISGPPFAPRFLFARAPGFRFDGRVVPVGSGAVDWTLDRLDQVPTAGQGGPAPAMDPDAARAMTGRLVSGARERIRQSTDEIKRFYYLSALVNLDPDRALGELESGEFVKGDSSFNQSIRSGVARQLAFTDPEKAVEVARSMGDPDWRSRALLRVADALPASEHGRKVELLESAAEEARKAETAADRVVALYPIGEQLLDLGETDRAAAIIREMEPAARELGKEGRDASVRGTFAILLSRIDLPGALAMLDGLTTSRGEPSDGARIRIARRIAATDPGEAMRLLDGVKNDDEMRRALPSLARALGEKDPAAARRLIEQHPYPADPVTPLYALGLIAGGQAGSDRAAAESTLREAFDRLEELAATHAWERGTHSPAVIGAALLPVAERIGPEVAREFLWRTLSLRRSGGQDRGPDRVERDDALIVPWAARVDRDAARALYGPLEARLPELLTSGNDWVPLAWAGGAVDPEGTARRLEALATEPGGMVFRSQASPDDLILALASWLVEDEEQRAKRVGTDIHLWFEGMGDAY